jgi:hypothetical protein
MRFGAVKPKESKNDISPHSHYSCLYLILQTTHHSTHTHASSTNHLPGKRPCGQMSFCANVFLGKCLSGHIAFWANVFWANVFLGKRPSGQTSFGANVFWANVFLGKYLSGQTSSGQTSSGQMSIWANVFLGKCLLGRCLLGKCCSGQMSFWANVSGQMSLGKCLWANVVWANVGSP